MTCSDVRPVPGLEYVLASSEGRLFIDEGRWWRELKPFAYVQNDRYLSVYVPKRGVRGRRKELLHRLVAMAFHGLPEPGQEVRHLNGDSLNNRPANLAWGTRLQNMDDMRRHGRIPRGSERPWAKLTEADVATIRASARRGTRVASLARHYGVSHRIIRKVVQSETWRHVQTEPSAHAMHLPALSNAGSRNGRAKLSEGEVLEIRARSARGESNRAIAEAFGISKSHAWTIVTGRKWRSVA